ncbi:hypothetical protein [Metabacillus sp. 84]|uniref:hypothetical protein n=1 Tax=unclassified Metabacillus TaxID=2675274 RepID=UPI003CFA72B9
MILRGGLCGLAGGFALGFFLKWTQGVTGLTVYTLLLNIDFLYPYPLPEWVEFAIHLGVAVLIGAGFGAIVKKTRISRFRNQLLLASLITLPAVFLYFPLSLLAIKSVPSIWNAAAFGWWSAGHAVFVLAMCGGVWAFTSKRTN